MAFGEVDFERFLAQKYALLQQQADAESANSDTAARNAATQAQVGRAAAGLDTARAKILPTESAAQIALQRAQAALTANQADTVIPESKARIGLIGSEAGLNVANTGLAEANTDLTKVNTQIGQRSLKKYTINQSSLDSITGYKPAWYNGYRLSQ